MHVRGGEVEGTLLPTADEPHEAAKDQSRPQGFHGCWLQYVTRGSISSVTRSWSAHDFFCPRDLEEQAGDCSARPGTTDLSAEDCWPARWEALRGIDPVTGLLRRAHWLEAVSQRGAHGIPPEGAAALLLVGLEGLEERMPRPGDPSPERLLQAVSERLKSLVGDLDLLGVVREGVFGFSLPGFASEQSLMSFAETLLKALQRPLPVEGAACPGLPARLGVVLYPNDPDFPVEIRLRQAELALWEARRQGLRSLLYSEEMMQRWDHRRQMESRFTEALRACKPFLRYQPIVDMSDGTLFGFEGLISWRPDDRQLVPAAQFIEGIEADTELARELGQYVLGYAAEHIEHWSAVGFEGVITVNISARHLLCEGFLDDVAEALQRIRHERDRLMIEVTETSPITDLARARQVIETLQSWGVRFLLDDFGTGNATMQYLQELPVDGIKIEKRFVGDLLRHDQALGIVTAQLLHAQSQGLTVIAEGVENESVGTLLLELGCRYAQGYCIAPPLLPWDIPNWLGRWAPPPQWYQRDRRPWPINHVDGMAAAFSHLRWLEALRHAVTRATVGESGFLDPTDILGRPESCRLDGWLRRTMHEGSPTESFFFARLGQLHESIHAQGLRFASDWSERKNPSAAQIFDRDLARPSQELMTRLVSILGQIDAPD